MSKLTIVGQASDVTLIQELPLYGTPIQAGFPSPADDWLEGKIDLNKHFIHNPHATYFLRVSGDSMIGAGIMDGDILVVDKSIEPSEGDIVIASVDGDLTVKRLKVRAGKAYLVPENENYQAIEINLESEMVIWGVVLSSMKTFKRY